MQQHYNWVDKNNHLAFANDATFVYQKPQDLFSKTFQNEVSSFASVYKITGEMKIMHSWEPIDNIHITDKYFSKKLNAAAHVTARCQPRQGGLYEESESLMWNPAGKDANCREKEEKICNSSLAHLKVSRNTAQLQEEEVSPLRGKNMLRMALRKAGISTYKYKYMGTYYKYISLTRKRRKHFTSLLGADRPKYLLRCPKCFEKECDETKCVEKKFDENKRVTKMHGNNRKSEAMRMKQNVGCLKRTMKYQELKDPIDEARRIRRNQVRVLAKFNISRQAIHNDTTNQLHKMNGDSDNIIYSAVTRVPKYDWALCSFPPTRD